MDADRARALLTQNISHTYFVKNGIECFAIELHKMTRLSVNLLYIEKSFSIL